MAGERMSPFYCWSWKIGRLRVYGASSDKGAARVLLSLKDEGAPCAFFEARAHPGRLEENKARNDALISAVEGALFNKPVSPFIALDIRGTAFQWKAWKAVAGVPFGMTRTYGQVAAMIGKTGGARAVGQAMGRNPLPLIFP